MKLTLTFDARRRPAFFVSVEAPGMGEPILVGNDDLGALQRALTPSLRDVTQFEEINRPGARAAIEVQAGPGVAPELVRSFTDFAHTAAHAATTEHL